MKSPIRMIVIAVFIITILGISGCVTTKAARVKQDCDRECLRGFMTQYLDALIAQKPGEVPVSNDMRYTENTVDIKLGEGLWKSKLEMTSYRQDILDPKWGISGTHVVLKEGENTILLLVRLKVVNKKITEIETQVTRLEPGGMFSNPTELNAPREAMKVVPPKEKLNSREDVIKIGLLYPEGLRLGSFVKADTPFSKDSYRIENGYITAGEGCMNKPSCLDLKTQPIPTLFEITSRVAAVDEELGIVWIRMDFGKNSMGVGPEADKRSLIVWEAFKVYDGKIHAVEAFMLPMPRETPSGWDN